MIDARHKVMHHRPIRYGELEGLLRIESGVDTLLTSAKAALSTEDQSKAQLAGKEIISQFEDSDFGPSVEENRAEAESWNELIDILLDANSSDEDLAEAGYRLTWYFEGVSEKLQNTLKERLALVEDALLIRIIRVIHRLLKNNSEPMAELVIDLLRYVPNVGSRIKELLREKRIPSTYSQTARQVIDVINQRDKYDTKDKIEA